MATAKTAKAAVKSTGVRFPFNFDAKDKSIKFELPELTNEPCMLVKVSNGKKDPQREFVTLKIGDHLYMLDGGALNEVPSFASIADATAKAAGYLSFVDGVRITHSGGAIQFSIAA